MDAKPKLNDESTLDMVRQALLPLGPPPALVADSELETEHADRAPQSVTVVLVIAVTGLAYSVDVAARGEPIYVAVLVAGYLLICACMSLPVWWTTHRNRTPESCQQQLELRRLWPRTAVARVLLWSFPMALLITISTSVYMKSPMAELALSTVTGLTCWGCIAEMLPAAPVYRPARV